MSTQQLLLLAQILGAILVAGGLAYFILRHVRQLTSRSFNAQLLVAFIGLEVVSLVLVVGMIIGQIQLTLTGQVGQSQLDLARLETRRIAEQLTEEVNLLQTLSRDAALHSQATVANNANDMRTRSPEERETYLTNLDTVWHEQTDPKLQARVMDPRINPASAVLEQFLASFPHYNQVMLIGPYGELLAAAGQRPPHYYYGDQTWWQSVRHSFSGKIFIGNVQLTERVPETTLDIVVPVYRPGKQTPVGVVVGRLFLPRLRIFQQANVQGSKRKMSLLDAEGRVLHSTRALLIGSQTPEDVMEDIRNNPYTWGIDPDASGQNIIHSHAVMLADATADEMIQNPVNAYLKPLQWTLIIEQPQAVALRSVNRLSQTALFGGAVVLALAIGMAQWLSRQLTHPIEKLTDVASRMAESRQHWQIEIGGPQELRQLAQAFNTMTTQIGDLIGTLEERIEARTRSLQTTAEIGRQITTILNQEELLQQVVTRLQQEFHFYHVHIYLIDEETGDLVMAEGSGEVGRQLKAKGHRLAAGQGIVGTVAALNEPFVSNNVLDVINFVPNPLLPDTKSEMAVPLRKGDRVLGVLDIQSEQLNRFTQEDVSLMQSIADQMAVAIDNARLLAQTQNALKEVERLNRRLTREVWEEFGAEITTAGYRFQAKPYPAVLPDSGTWLPPMKEAARRRRLVQQVIQTNGHKSELAAPLMLRGEVIGSLGIKREDTDTWSEEEIAAVKAIANQIALALENARLSQEQEKTIVKLKEVDRLKSDFLASMSHELRTPLNSIIGFADILLQGIDGPLSENAITDITAIHNSGKHLLALINDILDLSKIEAGRMELVRSALSIEDIFRDVAASVSSLLTEKPIELRQQVEPNLPPVWADSLRLTQVIINLVSNAIKFTDEGSVTMGAERHSDKFLHIYVQDTGIGIPQDKFDLVFEHFRQIDSRNNRKYQGTGMGLAIARQLVQLHGGEMWLESEVGKGSTFHFTIPVAGAAEEEGEA
ncbi:MAG: GAF domain-containing protein [Caldilineae bacterium]|nr:MAG: GAF domain-containing protein [Caldilineae bacterium]